MTRTLVVEWARDGVRINCLAPGPTETEGAALWATESERASVPASVPANRFTTPDEVAGPATSLLSDRARCARCARHIKGDVLTDDGGQWLGKQTYGGPQR